MLYYHCQRLIQLLLGIHPVLQEFILQRTLVNRTKTKELRSENQYHQWKKNQRNKEKLQMPLNYLCFGLLWYKFGWAMGSQRSRITSSAAEGVGVFPHKHFFLNKLMRGKKGIICFPAEKYKCNYCRYDTKTYSLFDIVFQITNQMQ